MRLKANVRRITGRTLHSVPAEDMPQAAWVELAQEGEHFFLYRFTSTGEDAGDTWHESMQHAKEQARLEYEIQASDWMLAIGIWDKWPPHDDLLSDDDNLEWALKMLLKHLQVLAAEPDILLRAYPPGCAVVDELVNGFDHFLKCSGKAIEKGLVGEGYLDKARLLDAKIDEMSGRHNARLWTEDALRNNHEWSEVRHLATEALKSMGYEVEPPPPRSMGAC